MNLRDLVNENSKLEELKILDRNPFEVDAIDAGILARIGMNHRNSFPQGYRVPVIITPEYVGVWRGNHDNSPEIKVIASYAIHKLKERGISQANLQRLKRKTRAEINCCCSPANNDAYWNERLRLAKEMGESSEAPQMREVFYGVIEHFERVAAEFIASIPENEIAAMDPHDNNKNIILSTRHHFRGGYRVINI
jgi:hypothetical protein